jgi:G:T/U-mismatch repair DNA glycosylase
MTGLLERRRSSPIGNVIGKRRREARNDWPSARRRPISPPMLFVISPAKALDFTPPDRTLPLTTPVLKDDIAALDAVTRKLRVSEVRKLMDLSETLATLNHERFQAFDPTFEEGLQAAIAFNGATSARIGRKALGPSGLTLIDLPSSSPAHTRPFAEKAEAWAVLETVLR